MAFEAIAYHLFRHSGNSRIVSADRANRGSSSYAGYGVECLRRAAAARSYTFFLMHIQRILAGIGDRITKAQEELRIAEEQLLFQMDVVEEAKTRMLVSETPLAEREYRIARDDYERLARQRDEIGNEINELRREQDRLLDRMLGSNA